MALISLPFVPATKMPTGKGQEGKQATMFQTYIQESHTGDNSSIALPTHVWLCSLIWAQIANPDGCAVSRGRNVNAYPDIANPCVAVQPNLGANF